MINRVVLVGKITKIHDFTIEEENRECIEITLAVPRYYKNKMGDYDVDFIKVLVKNKEILSTVLACCKVGDLIGVDGCVCKLSNDNEMYILVNKISFLAMSEDSEEND